MEARDVQTIEDAKQIIQERNLDFVKVGVFDIDGVLRGKYMQTAKFVSALDKGFGFCDVVLGWDSNDQLYDNVDFTGWHTGYPDANVQIIPHTCRELFEEKTLLFLGQFEGKASAICPRASLERVSKQTQEQGYHIKAALEYEFFLFDETPDSVREKGYQNLKPMTSGNFGYSVLRNSTHASLYEEIFALAKEMDFPLEGLHTETGPGVLEGAIVVDDLMEAADKAALFKTFLKVWAQKRGLMATFMARWSTEVPGQSGHIHMSMFDEEGKSVFYDSEAEHTMSSLQKQFLAGQQKYMAEFLPMIAPTVNSYSRLVPGFWAPTTPTWGIENRTCALRVIAGSASSQRIEYRLGAADANPYLALAAALASGLAGMEQNLKPSEPIVGNAYEKTFSPEESLPTQLGEAALRFQSSQIARQYLGDVFVEHFAKTRLWEQREYQKHVSDWELKRYFEII